MRNAAHRIGFVDRALAWTLGAAERWIIPTLPRGALRQRLRASIDRAQAQLHSRIHEHPQHR
jgi:hypothetical protein